MTEAKTIEHDPNEATALERAPESQTAPVAEPLPQPEPEQTTPLARRAELIPVGPTGAAPMSMAQQIDFGQYMAKARNAIPQHLQGNVGDCLAVIDIASRAGLSPYMVANKTYVQNSRLCFESQLFHALLVQSGRLKGDLQVTYQGEGDERTCTVKGTLRSDGIERTHTSQPLKEARPGTNDRGQIKGSPLWKDKPDVQLFYDTSRDWIRMFAPTATLGIYEPNELIEHPIGPEGAIDVSDIDPSLHKRLQGTSRDEGHQPGQAEAELNRVAAGDHRKIKAAEPKPAKPAAAKTEKPSPRATRRAKRASEAPKAVKAHAEKQAEKPKSEEKSPIQRKAEAEQAAAPNGQPRTAVEYWVFARTWILAGTDADNLEGRWDGERDMRDELNVPMARRKEMEKLLIDRCKELRGE